MFKNIVSIALRVVYKDKFYSLLNVLGLTTGLTCALFLFLYVNDELSFDRHYNNAENIYRVVSHIQEPDKSFGWNVTQAPTGQQMKTDYPVIENYTRFFPMPRMLFKLGDDYVYQDDVAAGDSTVFEVFSYPFLAGDPETALDEPNSIVLTEDVAVKYFNTANVVGETLEARNGTLYKVTGVIENIPSNTHISFSALTSLSENQRNIDNWGGFFVTTYIVLPDGYDSDLLLAQLPEMYTKYVEPIFGRMGIKIDYDLQPITSVHLYSALEGENNGNIAYVYIFAIVAMFVLIIAAINYMNLATARSSRRSKEVGIRKVMGSHKSLLIGQFLAESMVLSLIGFSMSLVLVYAFLPFFNELAGKDIAITALLQPQLILSAVGMIFLVGVLGGSYPAFFLSSFRPIAVLRGSGGTTSGGSLFRKALIVTQFSVALAMIISTTVVFDQLNYMRTKDLGYDKEHVLTFNMPNSAPDPGQNVSLNNAYFALRNSILESPLITKVASASSSTSNIGSRLIMNVEGADGMEEKAFRPFNVDHHYIDAMGMEVVAGRSFSDEFPSDTAMSVVINEATAERMNWDNPIGKKVQIGPSEDQEGNPIPPAQVIGVVKDFHQQSLYSTIEPIIIRNQNRNGVIHVKVNGANISGALAYIEGVWKQFYPTTPFEYNFLDQNFERAYQTDQNRGRLFTTFSVMTIIITCLGLLGLASYTAERRTKEIGVRKVVGASLADIVVLMSKDFIFLMLISMIFAFPSAFFFMKDWLTGFAYATEISPLSFALSAVLTLVITLVTVSFHTVKAALANPAVSLKSE